LADDVAAELVDDGPFLIELHEDYLWADTTEDKLWTWQPSGTWYSVRSTVGPWAVRPPSTRCRPLTRARGQRPRRRVSSSSRSRSDPPEPEPPLPRPLTRAEREYLKGLVDRRRRRQLVDERDHLHAVPYGGWT
jgi:hypothetical protein